MELTAISCDGHAACESQGAVGISGITDSCNCGYRSDASRLPAAKGRDPSRYGLLHRENRLTRFIIALVEDDQSVLEALESLLEYAGYQVLLCSSAEDLLGSGRLGQIDCLVTDIGLPGISGIELLRTLRAHNPQLPAIVITARSEPALLQAATQAGARQVFLKPLDNAQLLDAIEAQCR